MSKPSRTNHSTSLVLGTAGHIDHGKTSLVGALSGIDTDRLAEEKRRGISIELGFAHLTLPSGRRVSIIDVPGHERFVRNMLSGVTGIDLVLLIVAADESVKPQTVEHFEICRLLGIERGIVVLTKADLVDEEILSLVELEVADLVRGSFLEGAPVCAVSAKSGRGIPELLAAIDQVAAQVPARRVSRYPRLPIDRCFTVKGHGTIVTGTLRDAPLRAESELALYPTQKRARVRSVEVHGTQVLEAPVGARVALNLSGLEVAELQRGEVLAPPDVYQPTKIVDAEIEVLAAAKPIKDRAPIHFHSGSMEAEAELRLLSGQKQLAPGSRAFVRIVLREEALLLPGDRFILRSFSPVHTIAGGTILDLHFSASRLKRLGQAERLAEWAKLTVAERSRALVREQPLGCSEAYICLRLATTTEELDKQLLRAGGWLLLSEQLAEVEQRLRERLAQHHRAKPLEKGLSREAARSELLGSAPPAVLELLLSRSKTIIAEGDLLRLHTHQVKMAGAEDAAARKIEGAFRAAGLLAPGVEEVLQASGLPATQAKAVLALLLRGGQLVRVSTEMICHREALAALRTLLAEKKGQRFGVAEFKDWTGASRKYAIPLLEYLDREKLCRREGEQRIVL